MEITYSGPPSGKGASDAWDGGYAKGSIAITDAVPASSVTMLLHMQKPLEAQYAYIAKVIGVVVTMDKTIGGEFDKGLSELKAIAERL
jgi:hypothetical protein